MRTINRIFISAGCDDSFDCRSDAVHPEGMKPTLMWEFPRQLCTLKDWGGPGMAAATDMYVLKAFKRALH